MPVTLPSPVARMKYVASGGPELLFGFREVYALKTVEIMGREVQQVLVFSFNDLIWINCDKRNIVTLEANEKAVIHSLPLSERTYKG